MKKTYLKFPKQKYVDFSNNLQTYATQLNVNSKLRELKLLSDIFRDNALDSDDDEIILEEPTEEIIDITKFIPRKQGGGLRYDEDGIYSEDEYVGGCGSDNDAGSDNEHAGSDNEHAGSDNEHAGSDDDTVIFKFGGDDLNSNFVANYGDDYDGIFGGCGCEEKIEP